MVKAGQLPGAVISSTDYYKKAVVPVQAAPSHPAPVPKQERLDEILYPSEELPEDEVEMYTPEQAKNISKKTGLFCRVGRRGPTGIETVFGFAVQGYKNGLPVLYCTDG